MRLGSIIMSQKIKLRVVSGLGLGPRGQRSSRRNHLLARWWPQYFGTQKALLYWTFYPGKYNTWLYYANLLDQLRTAIREKRRGKLSKDVLLQQDNARVHTCKVAMNAVERNGYELIPHHAYSPDRAPSDFFVIPNLKKDIRGLHFRSDEEIVTAVEEWVNGKDPDFFSIGWWHLNTVGLSASH